MNGIFSIFQLTLNQLQVHSFFDSNQVAKDVSNDGRPSATHYGFLSIIEIDQLGYCGGLLVLTPRGRPVEFHCTAPVSANRAQQILYGQTLKEFICCDQIGVSLTQKVKQGLDLVLVNEGSFLSLAQSIDVPVVAVIDDEIIECNRLEIAGQRYVVDGNDVDKVADQLEAFATRLPVTEPFERIELAIKEAHAKAA